jgi:peptide/nickel transport system substrate-binding protein
VWESVASYVRDLAQTVHIDLSIEPAPSSTLVNRAIDGDIDIFGNYMDLSWIEADAGLQYSRPTPSAWTRWGQGEDGMTDAAQRAADAWDEQYLGNRIPTEEAQASRNEAYLTMERANWEDAAQIPLWHPTTQLYWYDWVEDYEFTGPLRRTKFNEISLGDRS